MIDEDNDIFRKEQVEKFYAEARPLREKYKPRELTDEEIMKIHGEVLERPHFQQVYLDPLKFARTILKKASEK